MGAITVLLVSLAGLQRAGAWLPAPPIASWTAAEEWYRDTPPAPAVLAGLRILAMGGVAWLAASAILQVVASCTLRPAVRAMADTLSPALLRRVAGSATSLSVVAGLSVPVGPSGDPPGLAVMEVVEAANEPSTTTTVAEPRPVPEGVAPPAKEEVVVAPGESFWSLAVEVLTDAGGGPPTPAEVHPYWQRLVADNRDRLVDPANPDLLYPAQVLRLPAP